MPMQSSLSLSSIILLAIGENLAVVRDTVHAARYAVDLSRDRRCARDSGLRRPERAAAKKKRSPSAFTIL